MSTLVDTSRPALQPKAHVSCDRVRAALVGDIGPGGETLAKVYGRTGIENIRRLTDLYPTHVTSENLQECLPELEDVEVIFSTWGMLRLSDADLDRMPRLRAVFYAAGSVQYFARPLLRRGIAVVSAWAANAVPVAEFTVGQILLANKGYFENQRTYQKPAHYRGAFRGRGNFGATVALLGVGQVGSKVVDLLNPFRLNVIVFDPFLDERRADLMGVERVSLPEAFARGQVVSNHLADVKETAGLLDARLFESMPRHATFINTGRGATVVEKDLIRVLCERPDLTALLDVTHPEPPEEGSPLWALPNVCLSSHLAGTHGDEVGRIAELVLEEFRAWNEGLPLRYAVTAHMLETMA